MKEGKRWMSFVFMYENRIVKPVEIVLRRGKRGKRADNGGVNLIKLHCKHICKCTMYAQPCV
jgi:hypothetical protein